MHVELLFTKNAEFAKEKIIFVVKLKEIKTVVLSQAVILMKINLVDFVLLEMKIVMEFVTMTQVSVMTVVEFHSVADEIQ